MSRGAPRVPRTAEVMNCHTATEDQWGQSGYPEHGCISGRRNTEETVTGPMADDDGDGDGGGTPAHASTLGELLDLVDEAVVICDRAGGTVRGFNRAATRLFPRLSPGDPVSTSAAEPLARAAARGERSTSKPPMRDAGSTAVGTQPTDGRCG